MVKSFDRLLIIDVESTCWAGQPPGDAESEIIEIGIALLDLASGEPLSKDSLLVKPERSTVSPFPMDLRVSKKNTPSSYRLGEGVLLNP